MAAPGAGWSALGAAIQNGMGGFAQAKQAQLQNALTQKQLAAVPNEYEFKAIKDSMGAETPYLFSQKTGQLKPITPQQGGAQAQTPNFDLTGEDFLATLDPKTAKVVKGVGDSELAVSNRAPNWSSIMAAAKAYNPAFSESEYPARLALKKSFKSGVDSQNIVSANQVIHHLDTLKSAGDDLNNSPYPAYNAVANFTAGHLLGDGRMDKYNMAGTALTNELAKLFKGTGASGEQEILAFRQSMNDAKSPEQQKAVIQAGLNLLQGRIDPVQQKWKTGMGTDKDYSVFTPEVKAIFDKLQGQPQTGGPPTSQAGIASPQAPAAPKFTPHTAGAPITVEEVKARMGGNPAPADLLKMIGDLKAEGTPVVGAAAPPRPNGAPPMAGQAPPKPAPLNPLDTNRLPVSDGGRLGGQLPTAAPRLLGNQMSAPGMTALQEREGGFQSKPYPDVNGLAIGYGNHTWKGQPVTADTRATRPEADQEMVSQIKSTYGKVVDQALKVPVSQQQYDALVSMAWNLPAAAKRVIEKLNTNQPVTAQDFQVSATVKGKPNRGLSQRRNSEFSTFMDTRAGTP